MKNIEKYKDDIICKLLPYVKLCKVLCDIRKMPCGKTNCETCRIDSIDWLNMEYKDGAYKITKAEYVLMMKLLRASSMIEISDDVEVSIKHKENVECLNTRELFPSFKENTVINIVDVIGNCEIIDEVHK